jgi:hypothetical protein
MQQTNPPKSVSVNGVAAPILNAGSDQSSADALAASTVNAAYYNQSLQTTFTKVFDTTGNTQIMASF